VALGEIKERDEGMGERKARAALPGGTSLYPAGVREDLELEGCNQAEHVHEERTNSSTSSLRP